MEKHGKAWRCGCGSPEHRLYRHWRQLVGDALSLAITSKPTFALCIWQHVYLITLCKCLTGLASLLTIITELFSVFSKNQYERPYRTVLYFVIKGVISMGWENQKKKNSSIVTSYGCIPSLKLERLFSFNNLYCYRGTVYMQGVNREALLSRHVGLMHWLDP